MTSNPSTVVKNSFSIENILSKPNKCAKPSYQNNVELNNQMTNFTHSQFLVHSKHEDSENSESCYDEVKSECFDKNQNSFTTPDSSCCGEEQAETSSDITSEESCKFPFFLFVSSLLNQHFLFCMSLAAYDF